MPASGSDSEDSADARQDGPSNEGGWIEAIGSVAGIAAEYAADFCQWAKHDKAAAKPPQVHLVVMWALRAQLRLLEVWALLLWGQVCRRRSE